MFGTRRTARRTGAWILEAERREPGDLDGQIEGIFSKLTLDISVWRELASRYQPELFVGLMLEESNEGIELNGRSLSLLADREVSLGLDVYGPRSRLRNIQIIDGADNATFSIFQATNEEFRAIFSGLGQDMEISEDFANRVGRTQAPILALVEARSRFRRECDQFSPAEAFRGEAVAQGGDAPSARRGCRAARRSAHTSRRGVWRPASRRDCRDG
jgi:Domain of unknown function (DUF4279)